MSSTRFDGIKRLNPFVNGYVPLPDFNKDLQCDNDDDMNDDLTEGPRKNYQCGPNCPGHPCKYKCGKTLHAQQFSQHKMECPNIPVRCQAAKDCAWHGPRRDLEKHISGCRHVALLPAMHAIEQLSERVARMNRDSVKTNTDSKLRSDYTQSVVRQQQQLIQQLETKLKMLESTVSDLRITALTLQNKSLQQQINRVGQRSRM